MEGILSKEKKNGSTTDDYYITILV